MIYTSDKKKLYYYCFLSLKYLGRVTYLFDHDMQVSILWTLVQHNYECELKLFYIQRQPKLKYRV